MRAWLLLGVTLAVAIVVAACAGHDWVTPADLWRAIEGDRDLRSRLLFDWRLPRVLAAALEHGCRRARPRAPGAVARGGLADRARAARFC